MYVKIVQRSGGEKWKFTGTSFFYYISSGIISSESRHRYININLKAVA